MSDARSQLVDVAAQLFADRGYQPVSMRDIAKVVGVTQANLYYHFRDKADLVQATLAHVFELRAQSLEAALADRPEDQLGAFVRWFVKALITDKVFSRLLYRELLDGDDERITSLSRTVLQRPFRLLVAAISQKRNTASADALALSVLGFVLGQVIALPLAAALSGTNEKPEPVDALATRLLALIRPWLAEA